MYVMAFAGQRGQLSAEVEVAESNLGRVQRYPRWTAVRLVSFVSLIVRVIQIYCDRPTTAGPLVPPRAPLGFSCGLGEPC